MNSSTAKAAMTDATALHKELLGKAATSTLTVLKLSGIITPGVYDFTSSDVAVDDLTLDAKGDPSAVSSSGPKP